LDPTSTEPNGNHQDPFTIKKRIRAVALIKSVDLPRVEYIDDFSQTFLHCSEREEV
jgi:hypothetical protein